MNIKKIISVILFVISVGLIISGFYILNSNKYIFKTVLSKSLDMLVENMYKSNEMIDDLNKADKFKITSNTNLNIDKHEKLSLKTDIAVANNMFYMDLNSKVDGKDFIKLESIVNNDNIYLRFKEAVDKYYYISLGDIAIDIDVDNYSSISDLTKDDIKVLTNHFKKSFLQDLNNDDFEKKSESLTFEGKTYKTSQLSLNLSQKEIRQIIINLFNNIINDNEAIQVLQKFDSSVTANDIKEALSSFEQESINANDNDLLNISFYISGLSDVVRLEILMLNSEADSVATDNIKLTLDIYKNSSNNNVTNIVMKENNEELFDIKLTKLSDNKTNFEVNLNDGLDNFILKGDYSETNSQIILNVDLLNNNKTIGSLSYNMSQVTKNKEYKLDIKFNTADRSIVFSNVNNILLNENIPARDMKGAVNLNNISEEDSEKIMTYIYEKISLLGLDSLMENPEDEYNFDDSDE